jgi:ubiquinone/menaquinone biosynthesis C-methylase UbiE
VPIVIARDYVHLYELRAKSKNFDEMAGRPRFMVDFMNSQIIKRMNFASDDEVVDVGCGDESLLCAISGRVKSAFGISPTSTEVERLRMQYGQVSNIKFAQGLANAVPSPDEAFTKVVCNGVMPVLRSLDDAGDSLMELGRIAREGALIYVGETVTSAEEQRDYSLGQYLWHNEVKRLYSELIRNGSVVFLRKLGRSTVRFLACVVTNEMYIIPPTKSRSLVIPAGEFVRLAERGGLWVMESFPHVDMLADGGTRTSKTRTDFLFVKTHSSREQDAQSESKIRTRE